MTPLARRASALALALAACAPAAVPVEVTLSKAVEKPAPTPAEAPVVVEPRPPTPKPATTSPPARPASRADAWRSIPECEELVEDLQMCGAAARNAATNQRIGRLLRFLEEAWQESATAPDYRVPLRNACLVAIETVRNTCG